jgi:hypothetical protein
MGIKKKAKEYLKFRLLGLVLTKIGTGECYDLGKGIGKFADEELDRQLGEKKSEASQAKIILRFRALSKGVEDELMSDMSDKQKDTLKTFKKEI